MAKGSLVTHCQTHQGMVKWKFGSEVDEADWGGDKPRTYNMVFLAMSSHSKYAVPGVDADGNEGALLTPAHQGERGDPRRC